MIAGLSALTSDSSLSGIMGRGDVYYVDATGGADGNSGREETDAWQTIAKVNGATFGPGDHILFKRGETWTAQLIVPSDDLVFGAYGSGAKPIIDGTDTDNCINGNNKSWVRFENLDIRRGLDFGMSGFTTSHDIAIIDCEVSACGNDNIVLGGSNIHISGLISHDPYVRVGGLTITCLEIADGAHDITVVDSEFYGSENMGISIHCHTGELLPYNIAFESCTFHDNDQNGINIAIIQAGGLCPSSRNITFDNCETYNNTQRGISIAAIDPNYPSGVTFRNCRSYANTIGSGLIYCDNITFQQCELSGGACSIAQSKNTSLINCTIYNHAAAGVALAFSGARNENTYGRNNIIMNNVVGQHILSVVAGTGVTGWDMDYNLYYRTGGTPADWHWNWMGVGRTWAEWKTLSGEDANSPTPANPTFTNAAGNDFTLQAGSPAINAGTDVGLPYCGIAPDCGAYEYCP